MGKKLQLAVLCGGVSAEHEISILSARNVVAALDQTQYEISVFYITNEGEWHRLNDPYAFLNSDPISLINESQSELITVLLGHSQHHFMQTNSPYHRYAVDCVFPVLHGTLGEDGTVQGLLEVLNVPYVGSGVLGSALCMEKQVAKSLLREAGIPTVNWINLRKTDLIPDLYKKIAEEFGEVLFVKPVGLGSSIGIAKVSTELDFDRAMAAAFQYDDQVMVEPAISGREIEISVLGNERLVTSLPGEIITQHDFYSYEAKYLDPEGALVVTPAELSEELVKQFKYLAEEAFRALQCSGMARVDFFLKENGEILINEVNTIPGFTDISMYPKNWQVSGVSYSELLDKLIQLALNHYHNHQQLVRVKGKTAPQGTNKRQWMHANDAESPNH